MQTKEIVTSSLLKMGYELLEAGAEGWKMDENNTIYVTHFGTYHVWLIKVEEHRAAVLSVFPPSPNKVSVPLEEVPFIPLQAEKRKAGRPKGH